MFALGSPVLYVDGVAEAEREVTTHLANGVGIGRPLAPNRRECERERDVHDVDSPTRTSNVMGADREGEWAEQSVNSQSRRPSRSLCYQ